MSEKACTKCKLIKPFTHFNKCAAVKSGLKSSCKLCQSKEGKVYNQVHAKKISVKQKAKHLRLAYGITPELRDSLSEKQGHVCAICLKNRPLQVDHCHKTGDIRGLLCFQCNTAIGKLQENVETVIRAAEYLLNAKRVL